MNFKKIWLPLMAASIAASSSMVYAKKNIMEPSVDIASAFKRSEGEFANTEFVGNALQLGKNRAFVPRQKPTQQLFGLYTSPPQQSTSPFNAVIANYDAKIPSGSELAFEVRTQALNGQWSTWTEIKPSLLGKPLALPATAMAWQYKLTFYADGPGHSPRVTSVSVLPAENGGK